MFKTFSNSDSSYCDHGPTPILLFSSLVIPRQISVVGIIQANYLTEKNDIPNNSYRYLLKRSLCKT
jgi:hypothetical protein